MELYLTNNAFNYTFEAYCQGNLYRCLRVETNVIIVEQDRDIVRLKIVKRGETLGFINMSKEEAEWLAKVIQLTARKPLASARGGIAVKLK
ncbi:MAG: hypothetical protein DRO12_05910 [Thermoprotei archaeon]|nr:MAG: hypothetical protein DRO12_05910 [Thermoprotei archaeon]